MGHHGSLYSGSWVTVRMGQWVMGHSSHCLLWHPALMSAVSAPCLLLSFAPPRNKSWRRHCPLAILCLLAVIRSFGFTLYAVDDKTVRCPTMQSSIESFNRHYSWWIGDYYISWYYVGSSWCRRWYAWVGGERHWWVYDGHSETTLCWIGYTKNMMCILHVGYTSKYRCDS